MPYRGEVLVAIMNNLHDFALAKDEHWYRIPVDNVRKRLKDRWPPKRLAFYQTKVFQQEAYAVNYVADVLSIRERTRPELFPDEQPNARSSRRWRYIIFIPTTETKFQAAAEVNDLYDESPLEDRLWAELKRLKISAERQFWVPVGTNEYFLDFAVPCSRGGLALETDGDTWHHNPEQAKQDNRRDNDLKTVGWHLFHFTTQQIREEMADYCFPIITENIKRLGGIDEGQVVPRYIAPDSPEGLHQLNLFYQSSANDDPTDNITHDDQSLPPMTLAPKQTPIPNQLSLLNDTPDLPAKPNRRKKKG